MTGRSHLAIGITLSMLLLYVLHITEPLSYITLLLLGSLGALLPDIDTRNSTISNTIHGRARPQLARSILSARDRRTPLGSLIYVFLMLAEIAVRIILMLILFPIHKLVKHRSTTHTLVFVVILAVTLYIVSTTFRFNYIYSVFFLAGYLSHILADSCTIHGVPLFYPLSSKNFHLLPSFLRIRTRRKSGLLSKELLLAIFVIAILVYFLKFYK